METHGIKFKDKLGYALGDMGGILSFSLVSSYLTMFYTDILGISAASITILMLVARIWDAVNDPMWGFVYRLKKADKARQIQTRRLYSWLYFLLAGM